MIELQDHEVSIVLEALSLAYEQACEKADEEKAEGIQELGARIETERYE